MDSATPRGFPSMFPSSYPSEHQLRGLSQPPQQVSQLQYPYQPQTMDYPSHSQYYQYSPMPHDVYSNGSQTYVNDFSRNTPITPQLGYADPFSPVVPASHSSPSGTGSPANEDFEEGIKDEPYAVLIYKALMSAPGHRMVLKDIYEWFEKYTDKAKSNSKGWQNSIRHNLSMNQGFRKVDQSPSEDGKKGYIWVLEQSAIDAGGIQSTTRFRKSGGPGPSRRGPRDPLAAQRYGGVQKSGRRHAPRFKSPAMGNAELYQSLSYTTEPTSDAEDIQMKVEPHINDLSSIYAMSQDAFSMDSGTQYRQPRLQQEQGHQYFPFPANGNTAGQYQPYTPPLTGETLAPSSPMGYQQDGASGEEDSFCGEEESKRILWIDSIKCEPGHHRLLCDGYACLV